MTALVNRIFGIEWMATLPFTLEDNKEIKDEHFLPTWVRSSSESQPIQQTAVLSELVC